MINVGLIGVGSITGVHIAGYKRLYEEGKVHLVACCDIRPEMMDKDDLKDCRKYTDVDEMLKAEAGKLDFVDICVPTFLHSEIAIKAMEAGFNVMSEKPMARTVEQAQAMIDASKRTGKKLMIAYCNRFTTMMDYAKKLIETEELGKVISAEFWRGGGSKKPMGWNNWFHDGELSGGAVLDLHIHDVDMIAYLFGMPKAVTAVAGTAITKNGYDYVSSQYMYGNSFYAHSICDWVTGPMKANTRTIRICFEHGYFYIDRTAGRHMCMRVNEDGTEVELTNMITEVNDMYYNEIKYFADCVENDLVPEKALPEKCIDSVKLVMAEIESADNDGALVKM